MEKNTQKKIGRFAYYCFNFSVAQLLMFLVVRIENGLGIYHPRTVMLRSYIVANLFLLLTIFITMGIGRTIKGIVLNSVMVAEVVLLLLHYGDGLTIKILSVTLLLLVLNLSGIFYAILLYHEESEDKRPFKYRLEQFFTIGRFFMVIALPLVIGFIYFEPGFKDYYGVIGEQADGIIQTEPADTSAESIDLSTYGEDNSFKNNVKRMVPFAREGVWEVASLAEKQDAMTAVIDAELYYLGVPYKISVSFVDLEEVTFESLYSYEKKEIIINDALLLYKDNARNLRSAIHIARHVYQYCICDAYQALPESERKLHCFLGVDKWCEEIEELDNHRENDEDVDKSSLEDDANAYTFRRASDYYEDLLRYLGE